VLAWRFNPHLKKYLRSALNKLSSVRPHDEAHARTGESGGGHCRTAGHVDLDLVRGGRGWSVLDGNDLAGSPLFSAQPVPGDLKIESTM